MLHVVALFKLYILSVSVCARGKWSSYVENIKGARVPGLDRVSPHTPAFLTGPGLPAPSPVGGLTHLLQASHF